MNSYWNQINFMGDHEIAFFNVNYLAPLIQQLPSYKTTNPGCSQIL